MSSPTMVSLRDLGDWSGGNTPSKANAAYWTNGTVPWVSPKDMKFDEIASSIDLITKQALDDGRVSLLPSGSVLFVTRSGILAHSFPVAVTNLAVTINQDLKALVPKKGISPKYVAHAMRGVSRRILKECAKHGTTVASIDTTALLNFKIPMVDLDAQHRIVAEIEKQFSRLDEAVANLKRVKANLKRYKAAVLKAAVEGSLVPCEAELARKGGRVYETGGELLRRILDTRRKKWSGKGEYKEAIPPNASELPALPADWAWANVGQIGLVVSGLTKNPTRDALSMKLPYLRVANVYANELRLDEITEIGVSENELEKLLLFKDDLLIVEGNGSPDQIGRVALWDGSINPCVHQNHLIKVRIDIAEPRFVLNWLLSPHGRNQIERATSSTSGLHTLSTGKIARLTLPLPPLAEQRRIVEEIERRLSLIRGVETQTDANLKRAERMRQSFLHTAFSASLDARQY